MLSRLHGSILVERVLEISYPFVCYLQSTLPPPPS